MAKLTTIQIPSSMWAAIQQSGRGWKADLAASLAESELPALHYPTPSEDLEIVQIPISDDLQRRIDEEMKKNWGRKKPTPSAILRGLIAEYLRSH